jgi:parvulin-like peptidyl-prolyl isomerase
MHTPLRLGLAFAVLALVGVPAGAQPPAPGIAAVVNGEPIATVAVQRGLDRVPPAKQAEARNEILGFLIDNLLVDQYLRQLNLPADPREIDARIQKIRDEIKRDGQEFDKVMEKLRLTEAELRTQIAAELRWEQFTGQRATEPVLRELLGKEPEMFDGSEVRARHILLSPPINDPKACEQAQVTLAQIKQQIERQVTEGLAKLPAQTDNLARGRERFRLIDEAFAEQARTKSMCPSKEQGGDVNWFPRGGSMVEPFSRAAFALQPYQMSDVVKTQFGYHLILVTDRRPGKQVTFEDVKEEVKEVYCARLRDEMARRLRPTAKITINPQ